MFETILLTEENLYDVAVKTRRDPLDLMDELLTARQANRVVCITYLPDDSRHKIMRNLDDYLQKSGLTFSEFAVMLQDEIRRSGERVVSHLRDQLQAVVETYEEPAMDADDLSELTEASKPTRINYKDPLQWLRARDRR